MAEAMTYNELGDNEPSEADSDISYLETPDDFEGDIAFELAQIIGDDLPDGAFWALYEELSR